MAVAFVDKDHLPNPRIQDRFFWHRQMASAVNLDLCIDIHIRLELEARVREIQAHLYRSRLFIDGGIDIRNLAVECDAGIVRESHAGLLSWPHKRDFALVDIDVYPHGGEISDGVKLLIRHDFHSLISLFLDDESGVRRVKRQGPLRLTFLFKLANLIFRDIPKGEPSFAGFD